MSTSPVSAFIIAQDEADRIPRAIHSVINWVDEVIVVDSGSSDDTVTVAQSLGATVIHHDWPGYGQQKRFAEEQCRNDWLLNLDADEEITPALAEEIQRLFNGNTPKSNAYRMQIVDIYPHETAPSRRTHFNNIRLYNRKKTRFADHSVHDSVQVTKGLKIGQLQHIMHHYSVRSLSDLVAKLNRYSDMQAEAMQQKRVSGLPLRMMFEFPLNLFRYFIMRGYWRSGVYGFSLSMIYAFSRYLRIAKYHEAQLLKKKPDQQDQG